MAKISNLFKFRKFIFYQELQELENLACAFESFCA
jgi:hypothetical protein